MDVASLKPGVDYPRAIDQNVESSKVVIAIIGPDWASVADAEGRRRLDQPDDFVVRELSRALERTIPIVPVLVRGATMPPASDLPTTLQGLVALQAAELSDTRWEYDVGRLLDLLYSRLGRSRGVTGELGAGFRQSPPAAFLQLVPVFPWIASAILLLIYAAPFETTPMWLKLQPVMAAVVGTLGIGIAAALVTSLLLRSTSADAAASNVYGEISERLQRLEDRQAALQALSDVLPVAPDSGSMQRALDRIVAALRKPGVQWFTRTGYLEVWRMLHRAEENLIGLVPAQGLLADEARIDERRLRTAGVADVGLLAKVQQTIESLETSGSSGDPTLAERRVAELRSARETVNELQYKRAQVEVNLRNRTLAVITVIGLTAALLALAANNASVSEGPLDANLGGDPVLFGVLLYVEAAVIAVVCALIVPPPADEGYGLSTARLFLIPLLAGLIGSAGSVAVVLVQSAMSGPIRLTTAGLLAQRFNLVAFPTGPLFSGLLALATAWVLVVLAARQH